MANLIFSANGVGNFILHHADGSHAQITDFQPHSEILAPGEAKRFVPYGGRSSDGVLSFFNLEKPDGTRDDNWGRLERTVGNILHYSR